MFLNLNGRLRLCDGLHDVLIRLWSHQACPDFHAGLGVGADGDDADLPKDGFPHDEGWSVHGVAVDGLDGALVNPLHLDVLRSD